MLTIQFLCPLPNGIHARPAWNLKNSAASGKAKSLLLTIARTQRPMRKVRWR